jgi:Putative Tad-like Flp pilus-assembly
MKRHIDSGIRPRRDRGQMVAIVALMLVVLSASAAIAVDIGIIYYSHDELVAATQAAALAGGAAIPSGTAKSTAKTYSGDTAQGGTYNVRSNLNVTGVTPTLGCIPQASYPNLSMPPCIDYGEGSANAIQVQETATVRTYFAQVLGIHSVAISATATATAKGGQFKPTNIVIVLDSTNSMGNTTDSGCTVPGVSGAPTPEQCAQYGVQQLLGEMDPCQSSLSSCPTPTNGMVTNPVNVVALMTFPGLCSVTASGTTCPNKATGVSSPPVQSSYASDDYSCPATNPPISAYNNNPAYLVLPYQSDYRASDTASALSTSSRLVKAVGGGSSPCGMPGIQTPGGEGTFYAGAIDAAQAYLTATSVTRSGVEASNVQNIIIFLSDGNANATSTQMGGSASSYSASNQCAQAVTRAGVAKNAGTLIYSVSYGSETTGCPTDTATYTPCYTMQHMASTPSSQYFFSVPQSGSTNNTVCPGARSITSLNHVFTAIGQDLTTSRLILNSTFAAI